MGRYPRRPCASDPASSSTSPPTTSVRSARWPTTIEAAPGDVPPFGDDTWTGRCRGTLDRDVGLLVADPDGAAPRTCTSRTTTPTSGRSRSRFAPVPTTPLGALLDQAIARGRRARAAGTSRSGSHGATTGRRDDARATRPASRPNVSCSQMRVPLPLPTRPPLARRHRRCGRSCVGKDEAEWLDGEQPRVRRPPRAGRLDRRHPARHVSRSRGSTPTGFLLAFDDDGPGRVLLDEGPPADAARRTRGAGRDLRDRRRPLPPRQRARARPHRRRARVARRARHHRSGCSSSTAPTTPPSGCTARSASPTTASTARTDGRRTGSP